jgi:hypothetical protein
VLGVIFYNYREDRFSSPSCVFVNDHRCATTPDTPSVETAACLREARDAGGYDCQPQSGPGGGRGGGGRGRGRDDQEDDDNDDGRGRGPPALGWLPW